MNETERPERSFPSRREFVALGVGAFVVATLPAAVRRRRALIRRTVPVMGTFAEFAVLHRDERYAQAAIDAAIGELRFVDRTMTWFSHDSDVGRANLKAAAGPVVVSKETARVLESSLLWAKASEGAFDPCLGKAVALWDVGHRHAPPAAGRVKRLAGRDLYKALELGSRRGEPVVLYHDPDVAIDLGGIAKGYAVDRAAEALRSYGIYNAVVNVGGDLYALGISEDDDPWKIGIRDPDNPDAIVGTVEASDCAIATSGDYLQYFTYHGRRYHHMLDPESGAPKRSTMRSVTVMADNCMAADAAGTAVFGMDPASAHRVLSAGDRRARLVHSIL
jgi:thiamine biosynthesis lipoprotein